MTRVKSVKADTAAYTCRDYSRPTTVHFLLTCNLIIFWVFTHPKKKATHTSGSFGAMIVIVFHSFEDSVVWPVFIQIRFCVFVETALLCFTLKCNLPVWLSVNTMVSMTSLAWSASCRGGWVQTPALLFSCRQKIEEGQRIELRWSKQFNWVASQPKKPILFFLLL